MSIREQHTTLIKSKAQELGFDYCGISKAEFLDQEAPRLEQWLLQGRHGRMKYMENYFDKRLDPRKLVDGAKTVVSLLFNYYPAHPLIPSQIEGEPAPPKISKYAYGKDYHIVIKEKLKNFLDYINDEVGEVHGRAFVDSAPVLDKAWAQRSGLGWVGKNTNLINKQSGSFFFIAELILDLDLEHDSPIEDYCGTCTACIDACPTEAIIAPYVVDGSKCISYFTIELKEAIPQEMKGRMDNWAFGCDVCQDVCPWNRFSKPHSERQLHPKEELLSMTRKEWMEITEDVFKKLFTGSAVMRTGYKGLKRNLDFIRETS